uniref:Uncharacterized protein n=1 Tax=Daucus carota subsp. sativus TaxID=79200 RepID=A0A162AAU2_DAUCS
MAHTRLAWHICPLCRLKLLKGPFLIGPPCMNVREKEINASYWVKDYDMRSIAPIFNHT